MKKILIINGPNLNLLGNREKQFYGNTTLKKIESICEAYCKENKLESVFLHPDNSG